VQIFFQDVILETSTSEELEVKMIFTQDVWSPSIYRSEKPSQQSWHSRVLWWTKGEERILSPTTLFLDF
jgi:hypothetical protein